MAALGSWLDARSHGGRWLLRIEDLDAPRVKPGAAAALLTTLAQLGLTPDETILHQSQRHDAYTAALAQLDTAGLLYPCSCARRAATAGSGRCTCRDAGPRGPGPWALRLRMPGSGELRFEDRFLGPQHFKAADLGDPILQRRDGQIAYQLAVVVDDIAQEITDVVRGADLLPATAWQLQIRRHLGGPPVRHGHLPLVLNEDGSKLSKSASAAAIAALRPEVALLQALSVLRQKPFPARRDPRVPAILEWATGHWRPPCAAGIAG